MKLFRLNRIISMFIVTLLFLLSACVTRMDKNIEQDRIQSILLTPKKLYFVGERYDYHFSRGDFQSLSFFWRSKLSKKVPQKAKLTLSIYHPQEVYAIYQVYLEPNTKEEKDQALFGGFEPSRIDERQYIRQFEFVGALAQFENRNELLNKGKMDTPIPIQLNFYQESRNLDYKEISKVSLDVAKAFTVIGMSLISPVLFAMAAVEDLVEIPE